MQLTETSMENKFAVIVKATTEYYNEYDPCDEWQSDDITNFNIFDIKEFEKISAFITLIQDIYNKQEQIQKWLGKKLNICNSFDDYAVIYLHRSHVIDILLKDNVETIKNLIQNVWYSLIPYTNDFKNQFPNKIYDIKIIKDSKMFTVNQPTDDDIVNALTYMYKWIKERK